MKKISKTLVFFGSGPVAAKTLAGLHQAGFEISLIITKPKPVHHKEKVPVLEWALEYATETLTPSNKYELASMLKGYPLTSAVGLVVDYGIIIDKSVIDMFAYGIVNSHFSLLPEWRGADPIRFSILSGQEQTGVSLMLINKRLDEGDLLAQEKIPILPTATTPTLTAELIALSNRMIENYLPRYLEGSLKPYPQPKLGVSYSRKLTKDDGRIDISKPAEVLAREVRAYQGWPKSKLTINNHTIVVTKAIPVKEKGDGLVIECSNHTLLQIQELIGPSGKTMSGQAFMNGYC